MTEKQEEATRIIEAIGTTTLNECYVPVIKSVCQCCGKRTIDYFNTKCKSCGTEHVYKKTVLSVRQYD